MRRMVSFPALALVAIAAIGMASPVLADNSVGIGYFVPTPDHSKNAGIIASTGLTLPVVPIAPQATIALPLTGGKYAVTGEARVGNSAAYVGVGAGFGRFNSNGGTTGSLYTLFVGKRILPHTLLEARYYGGSSHTGSTGFLGVRFAI